MFFTITMSPPDSVFTDVSYKKIARVTEKHAQPWATLVSSWVGGGLKI